jgi:RNA polymerase sigma factor (sigma-70 family)
MEMSPNSSGKSLRDQHLVQLALKGNQRAYAQLLDFYYEAVFSKLLRMTNDSYSADDFTIEAFSKAFSKLEQYTPDFAFSTWLFTIATNNCIDHLRKLKKEDGLQEVIEDIPAVPFEIPSEQPGPEAALIRRQERARLRSIVKSLKPNYRQLVELYYFEEHSVEEIATKLNLPEGTVKVRLFRARELLYNILKGR